MNDFVLNIDNDLVFKNGDISIEDSTTQEVGLILELTQGQLKSDAILGANLVTLMKSKGNTERTKTKVKLHLARDNKDYNQIKKMIEINVSNY